MRRVEAQLAGVAQVGSGNVLGLALPPMSASFGYAKRVETQCAAVGGYSIHPKTFSWYGAAPPTEGRYTPRVTLKFGLFGLLLYASPLYAHVALYQCSMTAGRLSPTQRVAFHFSARMRVPVARL